MIIRIISAGVLAFLFAKQFGKMFIPWLEKSGFIQPLKREVVAEIYEEENHETKS